MGKARKTKTEPDETLRTPAMSQAMKEVEAADQVLTEKFHREIARKGHSPDLEKREKSRIRELAHEIGKDAPRGQRLRTEKAIGGVRGKFHPSKKGQGKTVSSRSQKRTDRE